MKKLLIILCLVMLFPGVAFAKTEEAQDVLEQQQKAVDVDELKGVVEKMVSPESEELLPKFDFKQAVKDIALGRASFNMKDVFKRVLTYFFREIYINLNMIIKVIVLVLIIALLQNLQSAFGRKGVGEIAFYSCYILLAAILIKSFLEALNMGKEVISSMVVFMNAFIPTIFTLLLTTGNITTSSVLEPSIIFSIQVMSVLVKSLLLPMILFYTVLAVVNNISDKVQVSKLASFIKNAGMWITGLSLTIFIAIIELQSKVTSIADGVSTRTAKFAISTFVPIVGKIFSDAVDQVIGYSILLKNGLGIVGMIVILLICLIPIIKLFALVVIYKLTAAMIEPISETRVVKCISEMANSLTFIAAAVISVAVMFLISVSIMINAGNTAAMMR